MATILLFGGGFEHSKRRTKSTVKVKDTLLTLDYDNSFRLIKRTNNEQRQVKPVKQRAKYSKS